MNDRIAQAAANISQALKAAGLSLITAESCTGGLIAAAITEVPGSSDILERGYVAYSNLAKQTDLGVPKETLDHHGAVSEATARAMAEGALANSNADLSVSVTGIAGPDGGSAEKPVGIVHFSAARRGGPTLHRERRFGNPGRAEVRRRSVLVAFELLGELISTR